MSGPRTAPGPAPTTHDPLAWLSSVLWPADGLRAGVGTPPPGTRVLATYRVMPSVRAPRVLVPADAPRAAAASMRQFNQGMALPRRLRKVAAGVAMRLGVTRRVAPDVFTVAATADGAEDAGFEALLRAATGAADAVFAITVGVVRPNIKPVVCVVRPDGRVVAFAKVAWNELTATLVDRERRALRAWADAPAASFDVPRPIEAPPFRGFPVGVSSAAPQPVLRRGTTEVPLEVAREIAGRDGVDRTVLAASAGWRSLRRRIDDAVKGERADHLRPALEAVQQRHGDTELPLGSWHGDFAPWNTTRHRGRWTVWDWERTARGVPVGLDVIHWRVQVASHRAGGDLAGAVARERPAIAADLRRLDAGDPDALVAWYLAERLARYEESRAAGTLDAADPRPEACLRLLRELA